MLGSVLAKIPKASKQLAKSVGLPSKHSMHYRRYSGSSGGDLTRV